MNNNHLTPRAEPIHAGEVAPAFTLLDQDRAEVSLADLLATGGDVVLSFYPLDFTSVCTGEMECFTQDKPKFVDKGATVVGVSCDSFACHKAFAEAHGLTITLLADMHRQVCKAYGFYWPELNVAARGTVVISPAGVVRWVSAREKSQAIKTIDVLDAIG